MSTTRRGARLARLLAVTELRSWGAPEDLTERAELVVGELAANAVLHGRVPGRCFRLTLVLDPTANRLRVEVSDARRDLSPRPPPGGRRPRRPPHRRARPGTRRRPRLPLGHRPLPAQRQDGPGGALHTGRNVTRHGHPDRPASASSLNGLTTYTDYPHPGHLLIFPQPI
ncbi:ATP-binding protein [Streptomyces nodosus]|uniref:ATP-binding protein n=1 Tax=Streptomyces nodosus TaxID=40318 RepID=UPI0037F69317